MHNLKKDILNKIKTGQVQMRPHWHFVLKKLLLILSVVVTVLITIYVASFILFFLRQSGVGFTPLYGFQGFSFFILHSPWILIIATGALIAVLHALIHMYSFSFRRPLLYTLIGIVTLVLCTSYIIEQTQLHPRIKGFSEGHNVPVFRSLYRRIDDNRPRNIIFGTIVEISSQGFTLTSDTGEILTINITPKTKMPRNAFVTGDTVLVFGPRSENVITAIGIRPAPIDTSVTPQKNPVLQGSIRPHNNTQSHD